MGHNQLIVSDPAVHKKIWVEVLGAQASGNPPIEFLKLPGTFLILTQGNRSVTSIPGAMLSFTKVETPAPSTRGRSLDHTGVNVRNVNEYCRKLSVMGITCERQRPDSPIAFVTDPAGTRIEINQSLESR